VCVCVCVCHFLLLPLLPKLNFGSQLLLKLGLIRSNNFVVIIGGEGEDFVFDVRNSVTKRSSFLRNLPSNVNVHISIWIGGVALLLPQDTSLLRNLKTLHMESSKMQFSDVTLVVASTGKKFGAHKGMLSGKVMLKLSELLRLNGISHKQISL